MIWITTHVEIVLVTLLALVAGVIVLQQRRTPQSAAAWLLFIVLVPYLAIPVFLGLGFRKRGKRFKPISFIATANSTLCADAHRIDAVLQSFGCPPATGENRFELLTTPTAAYSSLMDHIAGADQSIDALFYIVANDPVGEAFVDALAEKARSGVEVRLLMDRLGSLKRPRSALKRLEAAGGTVRYFSPLLQRPDSGHLNLRNHRKMLIADQTRVFAGGMNVGVEYMGPTPTPDQWTDLAYKIEGPAVQTFRDVFRSDWNVPGGQMPDSSDLAPAVRNGTAIAQLVPCGPDTQVDLLHDGLVNAIHAARNRVWIATPYFLPTELLNGALAIAARRQLDVRILLPWKSNQHLADFARGAYLREMQEAQCKILFFQPGMIHAKVGVIDDLAYVGSANFDLRSMLLNFETALFVYDKDSVDKVTTWFAAQEPLCGLGIEPAGLLRRVLEGVFRLGAPVL